MAVDLNPGADPVLVAAASKAAMANVPKDYSKAFGMVAKGYASYAEGLGKIYQGLYEANSKAVNKLIYKATELVGDSIQQIGMEIFKPEVKDDNYETQQLSFTEKENELINTELFKFMGTQEGESVREILGKYETPEDLQRALQDAGYNIDFENDEGVLVTGEAAIDGKIGDSTNKAIDAFEKDFNSILQKTKDHSVQPVITGSSYTYKNDNNQDENIMIGRGEDIIPMLKLDLDRIQKTYSDSEKTVNDKKLRDQEIAKINEIKSNMRRSELKFGRILVNAVQAVRNGDLLEQPLNGNMSIDFLRAAVERGRRIEDGSHVKSGYDSNGNKIIIWVDKNGRPKINPATGKPFIASADNINNFLVKKDAAVETNIFKIAVSDQIDRGKVKNTEFQENLTKRNILKEIGTREKFLNAIYTPQGNMAGSYVESIYSEGGILNEQIYIALNKVALDKFDNSGDGVINEKDFPTQEEYAKLAKYLTEDSPGAREIYTAFMLTEARTNFQEGVDRRAGMTSPRDKATQSSAASRRIDAIMAKDEITINDIKSISSKYSTIGRNVIEENGYFVFRDGHGYEVERVKKTDRANLQIALYNWGSVSDVHRKDYKKPPPPKK